MWLLLHKEVYLFIFNPRKTVKELHGKIIFSVFLSLYIVVINSVPVICDSLLQNDVDDVKKQSD